MIKAARWYHKKGYAVIPVGDNKKPLVKWEKYQKQMPAPNDIEKWWKQWPYANIGLVTGSISNLAVIDIDSKEALEKIESMWPESYLTPMATTPRGGQHRYCRYQNGLRNLTGFIKDVDLRAEGGYIICPPSQNGKNKYSWIKGLSIVDIEINEIPSSIYNIINNIYMHERGGLEGKNDSKRQRVTAELIKVGTRDDTIFHIVNCLVRGKTSIEEIQSIITLISKYCCEEPFPESEINIKIKSVLDRVERQHRNWKEDVLEVLRQQTGSITTAFVQQATASDSRNEKKIVNDVLARLAKEKQVLEHTGKAGVYRIISKEFTEQNWKEQEEEEIKIKLPLNLSECIKVRPASILCFAAGPNIGKTALAMDFIYNNASLKPIFFSSEIHPTEYNERAKARAPLTVWPDRFVDGWTSNNIQDIIDADGINVIDYLEPPSGDYAKMATKLTEIHNVLRKGIAIVMIQVRERKQYTKEGSEETFNIVGGQGMIEKPQLFCAMRITNFPVAEIKILKAKATRFGYRNPYHKFAQFKVNNRNGCELIPITEFNFSMWMEG